MSEGTTRPTRPERPGAQQWVPDGEPSVEALRAAAELAHVTACRPWLVAELRAVDPDVTVVLGATAAKALLGKDFRVTQQRGEVLVRETSHGERRFVATVHPSSVLRAPDDARAEAYGALVADLEVVAGLLRGT